MKVKKLRVNMVNNLMGFIFLLSLFSCRNNYEHPKVTIMNKEFKSFIVFDSKQLQLVEVKIGFINNSESFKIYFEEDCIKDKDTLEVLSIDTGCYSVSGAPAVFKTSLDLKGLCIYC